MLSVRDRGLIKRPFNLKETRCTIISDTMLGINAAEDSLKRNRLELDAYVERNPVFRDSLNPVTVHDAPESALLMAEAGQAADVGPMAAVAGVLADLAVRDMVLAGAKVAVVEDGGEASLASDRPIDVALQAGESEMSRRIGFRFKEFPVGVATSSGLYSHAFSFGEAEAATVFAADSGLADAAATAVCNVVKGVDEQEAVRRGVEAGLVIEGVQGVLVYYRGSVGVGGTVPSFIEVDPDRGRQVE